jgi:hypothetical protein
MMKLAGYHLPPGFRIERFSVRRFGPVEIETPVLTATALSDLIQRLRNGRRDFLAGQKLDRLLSVCDEAVRRWTRPGGPERKTAEAALPHVTGLSGPMVSKGLSMMLAPLRADRLRETLNRELGDAGVLDAFQPAPGGRRRAYGPALITHILAGNLPGQPAAGLIASLLVKSASLAKTSSEEPLFAALFARTLAEIEPGLSDCLAVVGWKGGANESRELEEAALRGSDLVLATGGGEAIADLRRKLSGENGPRLVEYGHRVSFGLIGREALDDLDRVAGKAALDVALYDQMGCLSPHLFYVETGGRQSPLDFARALGEGLRKLERDLPRGTVSTETAAALHHFRSLYEMKQADGREIGIFGSESGNRWTVVYESDTAFELSPLHRTVRVKPVKDLAQVGPLLSPWKGYLQATGVAAPPERLEALAESLGSAGVNRICPVGRMQEPGPGWHPDGRLSFNELVRWVSWEESEE